MVHPCKFLKNSTIETIDSTDANDVRSELDGSISSELSSTSMIQVKLIDFYQSHLDKS
jgi:hypothetical protein